MSSLYINRLGNWNINLSVLLCNLSIIISQSCDQDNGAITKDIPRNWPCAWNNGVIPFVFDYFSMSPNRLRSLVAKGHEYIEHRSCLVFREEDPIAAANRTNFTYLFFTYSEVLESCCLQFFTKPTGRRLVLITPVCSLPAEIGHATLHGLGLMHKQGPINRPERFFEEAVRALLFMRNCTRSVLDYYE